MRKGTILSVLSAAALLTACGSAADSPLPEDAVGFETSVLVNDRDPDDTYSSMTYNGRTYIGYGTGRAPDKEYVRCIGYLIQDGQEQRDVRIWLLSSSPNNDYIAQTDEGFMSQPIFYRATDTRGKDIATPDYIDSLDYSYWK
jgi:hypothetical protein